MRVLSIILLIWGYAIALSQPQIKIEGNDIYDWGKIDPKGKPLTAKVKIFNNGNKMLKISEVKPGCGCTTAPLDKYDIEPKGFATLSITLNVSHDGPIQKSISISSNDPKSSMKNMLIKADIVRGLSISPMQMIFNNLEINKETKSKVTIKNNSKKIINIKDIIAKPKTLLFNIKKNTKIYPNKQITLEAKYFARTATNVSGKVIILTDNKDYKKIEITVWGSFPPQFKK